MTGFTKAVGSDPSQAANQDRITPNAWLTRIGGQGVYSVSGSVRSTTTLSSAALANLIDGLAGIHFHTAANPGGEIRGQIIRWAP